MEYKEMELNKVYQGDSLEILKNLPDNSIDSVVTDPPYGLGKEPDIVEVMAAWIEKGYHEIKGTGFMGSAWDSFVPQPILWKEVYRVLKPGGHMLVACGTRTQDWMVSSLRFAGFEVRDIISHIFAQGFPKSMNIGKKLDQMAGVEREIIGRNPNSRENCDKSNTLYGHGLVGKTGNITFPKTEEAKKWNGYGTGIKPAVCLWTLVRKPISEKTIAENVLKWGTGAINIDDCRIKTDEYISNHSRGAESAKSKGKYGDSSAQETHQTDGQKNGRYPANAIFDEEAGKLLDEQSGNKCGQIAPTTGNEPSASKKNQIYNDYSKTSGKKSAPKDGLGGASRFFFCPKASKLERNLGCEDLFVLIEGVSAEDVKEIEEILDRD